MASTIQAVDAGRFNRAKDAREAILSTLLGVGVIFLMFLQRTEAFGWRLAVYGGLTGFAIYICCRTLHRLVAEPIYRWEILPRPLVAAILYCFGGALGWSVATVLVQLFGLIHFTFERRDVFIALAVTGALGIVFGLAFYSFGFLEGRLRESVERLKEAEFAEKELELARDIQSRLLPPAIVEGEGFRVTARNLPARFVAGDFYDVFHLADGNLGLVIADVSGKGIGAALIMASVKAVVPLVAAGRSAADTLTQLNRKLSQELAPREFVALCFARFDAARGTLEIANAGLPDPYRLREDGSAESLPTPGARLPLGSRRDTAYESLSVQLGRTDRVLFVTDGLPEAPTPAGEPLGYEALAGLIASSAAEGPLLDRLFDSVRSATSETLEDDWTALLLERR
jgi:Stage II sporulation protein E (SpoIIE)